MFQVNIQNFSSVKLEYLMTEKPGTPLQIIYIFDMLKIHNKELNELQEEITLITKKLNVSKETESHSKYFIALASMLLMNRIECKDSFLFNRSLSDF